MRISPIFLALLASGILWSQSALASTASGIPSGGIETAEASPVPAPADAPAGPEGAPSPDISPEPNGGDIDSGMNPPAPPKRITLGERLALQNAVCALWDRAKKQPSGDSAFWQELDPLSLEAPQDVFISPDGGFYYENGLWIFEGLLRRMAAQEDGIEAVCAVQYFHVRFKHLENGGFQTASVHFEDVGAY